MVNYTQWLCFVDSDEEVGTMPKRQQQLVIQTVFFLKFDFLKLNIGYQVRPCHVNLITFSLISSQPAPN